MRRLIGLVCAVLCVLGLSAVVEPAAARASSHRSPGAVHGLRGVSHSSVSITLSWTLPKAKAFRATAVRFAAGTHAPKTVRSGHSAAHLGRTAHTLTVSKLRSGQSYAFSVFALDKAGHAGPRVSTVVAVAPAPVTDVRSFALPAATQVTWVNPKTRSFARVVVRVQKGAAAPATPGRGRRVRVTSPRTTSAAVTGLARGTTYAVSVWAVDRKGGYSTPSITRFTTSAGADPNGTVIGTVTDVAHHPLSGVEIDVDGPGGDLTSVTKPNGSFALSLPDGEYGLDVGRGHITGGDSDDTGYVSTSGDAVAHSGRTTRLAPIALKAGAKVTGTVVDSTGKPVAGAYPYAVPVNRYVEPDTEVFGNSPGAAFGTAASGANGTFALLGVPTDGAVRVCAEPTDDQHSDACADAPIVLAAGMSGSVPALVLPAFAGGTVEGTVRGSDRSVVDGAWVYLRDVVGNTNVFLAAPTDFRGHYEIDSVPPGTYQACAQTSTVTAAHPTGFADGCSTGSVSVSTGTPATLNVTLPIGAALAGTITGPTGHPVARVVVSVQDKSSSISASTDSHGQYVITGIDPGSFRVCYYTDQATGSGIPTGVRSACWHGGATVAVTAGRVRSGIDARLAAGAAISGRVVNADGTPAANVFVDASPPDDDGDDDGDDDYYYGTSTETDANGTYVLRGLRAGSYDVCFDSTTAGGADIEACGASAVTARIGRTVTGVNGTLPADSGIRVTVLDPTTQAVAGVDAVALSSCPKNCDAQPLFSATAGVSIDASSATDSSGSALLDGIAPGKSYAICLYAFNGTTATGGSGTGYADACNGSTFTVPVVRGQITSVTLTLARGGAVSGTITDAAGHPVAGAQALVSNSAATDLAQDDDDFDFGDDDDGVSSPRDYGYSSADGSYTVIGVRPGSQTVCFDASQATGGSSPAGYRNQCLGSPLGSPTGTTAVTVTAAQVTAGVTMTLAAAAGVAGTVRHGGAGLVGATVIAFNGANANDVAGVVTTGAGGHYTLGGLTPGTVTVCFAARGLHYQCWKNVTWDGDDDPPLDLAKPVTVQAGILATGVDATLK